MPHGTVACMNTPADLIPASVGQRLLGISKKKMASLLRDGTIRHFDNPLDRRQKLVSKSEVMGLIPKRAEAA